MSKKIDITNSLLASSVRNRKIKTSQESGGKTKTVAFTPVSKEKIQ